MAQPRGALSATLVWKVRSTLSASGRLRARRAADRLLSPIGSISGALNPTRAVALTFDDGPDPVITPPLLALLRARQAKATFFVLTDRATRYPEIVRRIAAEGHEVALHADRHDRLTLISARALRQRIGAARRLLESLIGQKVRFFRPPYGAQSIGSYLATRAAGLEVVVWGTDAHDWEESVPEEIAERGLRNLKGGDILLLHDGLEIPAGDPLPTFDRIGAFALILDGMAARGLTPTTIGTLIGACKARRTAWFRP